MQLYDLFKAQNYLAAVLAIRWEITHMLGLLGHKKGVPVNVSDRYPVSDPTWWDLWRRVPMVHGQGKAPPTTSQAAWGSLQCSRKQGLMDSLWSSWRININECERDLAGDWDTKQFWQWFARCPEERWGVVSAASETLRSATGGTGRTEACSNLRLCRDLNQHSCWRKQEKETKRPYDSMWPYLRGLAGMFPHAKIKQVRVRTWYEKAQVYYSLVTLPVTSIGYRGELVLKEFDPSLCKC